MADLSTIENKDLSIWEGETALQEIKDLFAPNLTELEFKGFVNMGKALQLNPFLREIWAVKYDKTKPAQIFIGRDGYRLNAKRHPQFDYMRVEAVYSNDEYLNDNGVITHKFGFANRGTLLGAYCIIKRKDSSEPEYRSVLLSEYDKRQGNWNTMKETMIKKCFDDETEILTDKGFQKFDSVTGNILQISENGIEKTDSKPFHQDYTGEMIQYDGQYLNFSVTPNHNMITTTGNINALDLLNKSTKCYRDSEKIPSNIICNKPDYPLLSDEQIKLAGYYIADGSHTGYRQMRISVSRQYKIDELTKLNLHSSMATKKSAGNQAKGVNGRIITTSTDYKSFSYNFSLIEEICHIDKTLNMEVAMLLSQRQAQILVESLVLFDGHISNTGTKRFYTSRVDILKQFELICILAGYAVNVPTMRYSDISKKPGYFIVVSKKKHYPVVSYIEKKQGIKKIPSNTSGKVWCVTVPSGKIIVRRNGFSMICGNCAEAQSLKAAFPEKFNGTYSEYEEGFIIEQKGKSSHSEQMSDILAKKGLTHASSTNAPINHIHNPDISNSIAVVQNSSILAQSAPEIENIYDVLDTDRTHEDRLLNQDEGVTKASKAQLAIIDEAIHATGFKPDRVSKAFKHYGVKSFADMTEQQADEMIEILNRTE